MNNLTKILYLLACMMFYSPLLEGFLAYCSINDGSILIVIFLVLYGFCHYFMEIKFVHLNRKIQYFIILILSVTGLTVDIYF
ncbi:MAG: hypothetical protein GY714_18480 [Desulfobacterales bacterium]|nr:hypothetical protein [Desulfobacterales bacterium]